MHFALRLHHAASLALLIFASLHPLSARDRNDSLVRESEALTSEQERAALHVPDGFEVQLFADDSQVGGKPINMAFDARGRLWVSSTREYPYAMKKDKWSADTTRAIGSKDTIRILEDTDGDGRADKVTIFADDMNIPTGVLPYKNGCIAWSIPNILYLEDTDGDGKADKRTILFGPLGWEKDTHGMISSLRMGLDGWVYATHGFSNTSHFQVLPHNEKPNPQSAIRNPQLLDITSGSVFRFQPDGSSVERWTNGQVNPFGLCWDSWGNLYSADCHSSPVYQLIRGASYPSFGKPHDGLGFAPIMCSHSHGSTGIAGVVYIDGGVWGPEWDDHLFLGNPVTSKVNHDHVTFTGSTPKANEKPDLITSDDPWFRPVDLQLGPDSALYVADFYNKIIGHYEVPLDHPGRDRDRGRIWRVVRKGFTGKLTESDLTRLDVEALRKETRFGNGNLTRGFLAASLLRERNNENIGLRMPDGLTNTPQILRRTLSSQTGNDVSATSIESALANFKTITPGDTALLLALRIHLRDLLINPEAFDLVKKLKPDPAAESELFQIAIAVPTNPSADWLLSRVLATSPKANLLDTALFSQAITHIARNLPAERTDELVDLVQKHFSDDLDTQLDLFAAVQAGSSTFRIRVSGTAAGTSPEIAGVRGRSLPDSTSESRATKDWAAMLTQRLLTALSGKPTSTWESITPPADSSPSPWFRQKRTCADGTERDFLCSLPPGGEKLTGTLRSKAFDVPQKLSFWIAGHRGVPGSTAHEKNFIRLLEADSDVEIAKTFPPRNDSAQLVTWDLPQSKAKRACIEVTDGDSGSAFAWFAVGGFSPEVVSLPNLNGAGDDKRIRALAELCNTALKAVGSPGILPGQRSNENGQNARSTHSLQGCVTFLSSLPNKARYAADTRFAIAEALAPQHKHVLATLLPALTREAAFAAPVLEALSKTDDKEIPKALAALFNSVPHRQQVKLAESLSASRDGARSLLTLAPPRVLADSVVTGKIKALGDAALSAQIKELTAKLPPQNEALLALITTRLKTYDPAKADVARGEAIFTATCAVCHRIGIRGNLVGPQLDGIGARGAERLLEDILDPNRAVDPAFRLHFVKQKNGALLAGILRREAGDSMVFADAAAQEHTVKKTDITEDQVSEFSLMPAGMGEALTAEQVHDLMRYLLGKVAG